MLRITQMIKSVFINRKAQVRRRKYIGFARAGPDTSTEILCIYGVSIDHRVDIQTNISKNGFTITDQTCLRIAIFQ